MLHTICVLPCNEVADFREPMQALGDRWHRQYQNNVRVDFEMEATLALCGVAVQLRKCSDFIRITLY
jgi:hypothetical protein